MLIPLPLPLLRWSGIVQALRRVFAASSFVRVQPSDQIISRI